MDIDRERINNRAKELNLDFSGTETEFKYIEKLIKKKGIKYFKPTNKYSGTYGLKHHFEHAFNYQYQDTKSSKCFGYICEPCFVLYIDMLGYKVKKNYITCGGTFSYKTKLQPIYKCDSCRQEIKVGCWDEPHLRECKIKLRNYIQNPKFIRKNERFKYSYIDTLDFIKKKFYIRNLLIKAQIIKPIY